MLRRYNSQNLDTLVLQSKKTTFGSGNDCDVVIKGKGIAKIHASLEATPNGFFLREHSLSGLTKVNDAIVVGQTEIYAGDMLQFGENAPFIFDNQWVFGSRPTSSKVKNEQKQSILPVLGKRMIPIHPEQKITSSNRQNSTIRHTRSVDQGMRGIEREYEKSVRSSASSTESYANGYHSKGSRSTGNNLLQRVIRLQHEGIEKDKKIQQLLSSAAANPFQPVDNFYHQPPPTIYPQPYPPSLQPIIQPIPHSRLGSFSNSTILRNQPRNHNFELCAYRGFISAISQQLRNFNDRVLRNPQREYAEVFTAMCRAIDVPLSNRISEIEKFCESFLIDNDFEESEELVSKLDNFIRESRREKILELTNELEMIMPIIRDAASNARENIKVCNVFTQWSRTFGDMIRSSNFSSKLLFESIEDLKKQFADAHMSRHWLPPSITPILRLAAHEIEKKEAEFFKETEKILPQQETVKLVRKRSIDETLDSCISHVETIEHEMEYHISRLETKAKDYQIIQSLESEKVLRLTKVMESMKQSISLLSNFASPEIAPRVNSVLFFEVTENDIGEAIRKDSESTNGTASRKISGITKSVQMIDEDGRKDIEERMNEAIQKMSSYVPHQQNDFDIFDDSSSSSKKVTVSVNLINKLLRIGDNTLQMLENEKSSEAEKRVRRSTPLPSIEEDEKEPVVNIVGEESTFSKLEPPLIIEDNNEEPKDVEHISDTVVEDSVETETTEVTSSKDEGFNQNQNNEEVIEKSEGSEEEEGDDGSEEEESVTEENELQSEEESEIQRAEEDDYEEEEEDGAAEKDDDVGTPDEPNDVEVEVDHKKATKSQDSIEKLDLNPPPIIVHHLVRDPELLDQTTTIEAFQVAEHEHEPENTETEAGSPTSGEQENDNEDHSGVLAKRSQSEERVTSHYKSHMNTANGRPNIVYQFPLPRRSYHSPPMKRRSKSEDKNKKSTIIDRPRFNLY